jgi:hypothetical protein
MPHPQSNFQASYLTAAAVMQPPWRDSNDVTGATCQAGEYRCSMRCVKTSRASHTAQWLHLTAFSHNWQVWACAVIVHPNKQLPSHM